MLQDSDIKKYSIHNEGKYVATKRLIKNVKNKIYKYMISVPKNVYINKLNDKVNNYYHAYHRTINMKLVDVKSSTYIEFGIENKNKNP